MTASPLRLSILNFFSPPGEVLGLAGLCDEHACFDRFWIGEHHSQDQVPDPLALCLLLAAATARIRLGTGAASLTFRNPYMLAETAILAEMFFPGRIDLGVTKAAAKGGGVFDLLMDGANRAEVEDGYERRLTLLRDVLVRETPLKGLFMDKVRQPGPPVFVMGVSEERAAHAGALGMGFVASFHHGGTPASILGMMRAYRRAFRPSPLFSGPHGIVVVSGYVSGGGGSDAGTEEARKQGAASTGAVKVYGAPAEAALELRRLAASVEADEVMFICDDNRDCASCYAALAAGWEAVARAA